MTPVTDGRYVVWLEENGHVVGVQMAYFTCGVNYAPINFAPFEVDTVITGIDITGYRRVFRGRWLTSPKIKAGESVIIPPGKIVLNRLNTLRT